MSFIRKLFQSHRARVTMALIVIGIAVVVAFFVPKEPDPTIFDEPATPTVAITNPTSTLTVNKSITYSNVQITVTQVQEATAFSDDEKPAGTYTVRVNVHIVPNNNLQSSVGIAFASVVRLMLSNGQEIAPKLVNAGTVIFPRQPEDGYFDFPVSSQLPLSSLTLKVGSDSLVAFNS